MIGRRLGQYLIVEELGGGGYGVVYRAEDTRLGRDAAIKVLPDARNVRPRDLERFLNEARAAAALRHPNICTIYDADEIDGISFISMAYIPGRTLREMISEGPLSLSQALDIAIQVGRGLEAAHEQGIVHRDIKSANIIVDGGGRATILDFGIARFVSDDTDTGRAVVRGTVAYMSPEQAGGDPVDARTDIWSLGVCLHEMLSGELPFRAGHETAVIYQILNEEPPAPGADGVPVPRSVRRIVDRALAKRAESRYQTVRQMVAELEEARRQVEAGNLGSEPSVAVLPFSNLSAEAQQRYFCEGMAEEVINSLAQVNGLRVAARTSSFAFRDAAIDVREIGRQLDVDNILEGSVQKAGNRIRITAQLISVADGYHIWSQRFDRDLEDVFAIQDEIARSIAEALEVTLTERELEAIERVPARDMKAYEFHVRGMHHYHDMTRPALERARNMFTSAIVCDPGYAPSYCGLADCYSMIDTFHGHDPDNIENALTCSEKAIELEPTLGEAHASRGLALSLDERFDEADAEFALAVELAPRLFEAYYFHARACRARGQALRAARLFEKAAELRPEDYQSFILAGDTYRGLDLEQDMKRAFTRGLAVAERHVELHPEEARAWYLGAHAYLVMGNAERARQWSEKALQMAPRDPATLYNVACLFSLTGDVESCFRCFEVAVANGFSNRRWLENDPDLDAIRDDPRYARLLAACGPAAAVHAHDGENDAHAS